MALTKRALCTRGFKSSASEEDLQELYKFFQQLQRKNPPDDAASYRTGFGKVIFIAWPRDWFVTEDIGPWWSIETCEKRQQFFEYVAHLHRLGLPSFFCERRPIDEMKFFMQFQANLDGGIQHGAKDMEKLARLKRQFLNLIILAMSQTALEFFGENRTRSNLVAVFDASGEGSPALDFRVCFPELVCSQDEAYSARKSLVSRLEMHWHSTPHKVWRALIQPPRPNKNENLWSQIVNEKALSSDTMHTLVWCNTVTGTLTDESRQLLPYGLFHTKVSKNDTPTIDSLQVLSESLPDWEWCAYGSPWLTLAKSGNSSDSDLSAVTHASALPAGRWIRYQVNSARSAVINDITGERKDETSLSSSQLQQVYIPKHNEVFFTHARKNKETYYSDVTDDRNVIYKQSLPLGATTLPPQS